MTAATSTVGILFCPDIARLLGITEDAVRKALREGRLCAYGRVGRRLFVREQTFAAFLASREADPTAHVRRGGREGGGR